MREVVMRSLHTPSSHCDLELQNMPWCISVGLRGEKEKKREERENQTNDWCVKKKQASERKRIIYGWKAKIQMWEEKDGRDRAKEIVRESWDISALTLTAQKSPGHEVFTRWHIKYECDVRIVQLFLVSLLLARSYAAHFFKSSRNSHPSTQL